MKLQTPVTDLPCKVGISYDDRVMMLGSCFADNVGRMFGDYGFNVCVNPFGTLYNPLSILGAVERLVSAEPFTPEDCIKMGAGTDKFCSFSHHTSFAREDAGEFLLGANQALERAAEGFRFCNKVVVTLGTAWCYRWKQNGKVVSNCLKRPAAEFDRLRMSAEEVTAALERMMDLCRMEEGRGGRPKSFIFTVSPIRHLADGAHGNQLSKSSLLLGTDSVQRDGWDYFPAYELMMDELRDYRFYAEDMCHPTRQAEEYVCSRFLDWALPEEEHKTLEQNIKAFKSSRHIPSGKYRL